MINAQPSVSLLGIRIDEPVNTVTDLIVSAVCLVSYYGLRNRGFQSKTHTYFKWYFLLLGLATFFGGLIGHAFLYLFSFDWKLPGWILSMLSVAFIERSSIEYARPHIAPGIGNFFLALNIIELLAVMGLTIYTMNFEWVEFHSGYGLLAVVLPFHGLVYLKTRDLGSLYILGGVGIACVAALIFMNEISLHTWFNHIDASHVLVALAAFVFYRGALQLKTTKS